MNKLKLFKGFLYGLLIMPCFLFLDYGTGGAQEIAQKRALLSSADAPFLSSQADSHDTNTNITKANNLSKTNFLLNWAEYNFPDLFPSGPATQYMNQPEAFYRTYSTGVLLGTHRDHIYLLDQQSRLTDYGSVDDWVEVAQSPEAAEVMYGYVYSTVTLDRTPGQGDCGTGPWADPYCTSIKIWWKVQLQAFAMTPVLIIPDGENRWVITNMGIVGKNMV